MKIGDLVQLSAYGNKLKMFKNYYGKVGLLIRIHKSTPYDYIVRWCGVPKENVPEQLMQRKDIKKVK